MNNRPTDFTFYSHNNYPITLINCTIDDYNTPTYLITDSISSPSGSFINVLKLLNTGNCYGTYDVVDEIPFVPPTPDPTPRPTVNRNLKIITCTHSNYVKMLTIGSYTLYCKRTSFWINTCKYLSFLKLYNQSLPTTLHINFLTKWFDMPYNSSKTLSTTINHYKFK